MFEQLSNFRNALPSLRSFRNMSPLARRELRQGVWFLSPWLFGFLAFTFIPLFATLFFTFIDLKITDGILSKPDWVGLKNYMTLWNDNQAGVNPASWFQGGGTPGSLWVTIAFGLIALPVGIFAPLFLAVLMNNKHLKAPMFFRSMFYMPYIIPFVAAVFLWGGMLNPESGWINRFLLWAGVAKGSVPLWANSGAGEWGWIYATYVLMGIWGIGNAMLIMIAGLQNVPTELYDAARVDGANGWQTFWKVTFPMISPVIFYNVVLSVVGLFQYFLVPLVVNQGTGRPGGFTMFYNLYLYKNFFLFQNMSYGATLAWVLFLIILVVTIFLFGTAKYWVYYAGESRS
jgi:multiple sugar transport system permease protein